MSEKETLLWHIEGGIYTKLSQESWLEAFIDWLESRGESFMGVVGATETDGKEPPKDDEPRELRIDVMQKGRKT